MEAIDSYEDGDFDTPAAISPLCVSYPFRDRGDTKTRIATQEFQVRAASIPNPTIGSSYPYTAQTTNARNLKLVDQSEPTREGADIVNYTRTWADLPQARDEAESYNHVYQFLRSPEENVIEIREIAKQVSSIVRVTYVETKNPGTIAIKNAFRWMKWGDSVLGIGDQNQTYGNLFLAENTMISRWMGNFWEVRERYVPAYLPYPAPTTSFVQS